MSATLSILPICRSVLLMGDHAMGFTFSNELDFLNIKLLYQSMYDDFLHNYMKWRVIEIKGTIDNPIQCPI